MSEFRAPMCDTPTQTDALLLARKVLEWANGGGNRAASQWIHSDTVMLAKALLQLERSNAQLLAALEDAAKVINAMTTGKLPECFKPTLEMVNDINYAIRNAKP